jgi:ribosomal protein S18 acetylase RimI-like enzyme
LNAVSAVIKDLLLIEAVDVGLPEARLLITRLTAELAGRYHDDGAGDFQPADVQGPRSGFLLARWDAHPVACGAYRSLSEDTAEIKRMYVDPAYRGRGIGRRLLVALEERIQKAGYRKVQLDTGTMQPEALGLYESAGYHRIEPYGYYREDPRCICFAKVFESARPR